MLMINNSSFLIRCCQAGKFIVVANSYRLHKLRGDSVYLQHNKPNVPSADNATLQEAAKTLFRATRFIVTSDHGMPSQRKPEAN